MKTINPSDPALAKGHDLAARVERFVREQIIPYE